MLPAALFVSAEIQAREVELPDGSKHTLHFKELPAYEFRRFQIAEQSDNDEKRAASMARLIAASLCDPEGKPAITESKAKTLNAKAMNSIMTAILEVNGFRVGGELGNDLGSAEMTGSGTS
jgi:hypothetical protein